MARLPPGPAGGAAARRPAPRGAALLVVMVAVALVTAAAVDLAYQARVSLQIAGNARDELKAQAQARGAVALGRLVLHFQAQLDEVGNRAQDAAKNLGGTAGALAGGQASARPQLWRQIPIDSDLAGRLFAGSAPLGAEAPAPEADGRFEAVLDDEDRKVNVQLDGSATTQLQGAQLDSFLAMVADKHWDFLFDRDDANGQRTSRTDLAIHLKDWVDDDQVQSSVTGLYDRPFEAGFGDENFAYDRGPDRYKAKNARFDSLDELFLVTGVSDAFMAAFGDRLTVFVSRNAKMNVNADDPVELVRNARIMADPPQQPLLDDPTFGERLQLAARELRLGGFLSMTPMQFAQLLQVMGLTVNATYLQANNKDGRGAFTDRSRVYTVRGSGTVGRVEKTIAAVVSFDPEQAREQATGLGRLLHWREE